MLVNGGSNKTENTTWNKKGVLLPGQNTKVTEERCMQKKKTGELKLLGILQRKRGRPQMYDHAEALEMKPDRAREYAIRSRAAKKLSQLLDIFNASEKSSEEVP